MSQVDQVRAAADIVKIVRDYVKLRKAGANYMGLCPFHQEKTPSFAVHPTKQIFHCFGCGVGGDVFKFVMMVENLSFPEALRRVAEKVGVRLRERRGDEYSDAQSRERALLYKIHEEATKFFAAQLSGTSEGRVARAYLADRGLTDEVVGVFRLGYAPADGQALTRHLLSLGYEDEVIEKSGLILRATDRDRHFDRFRQRVMFPIANESGKVVAFGGRSLGDEQPKYVNSPETPIYTKSRVLYHLDRATPAIRKLDYAVLVEGYLDCIAVASAGVENVVASCGTSLAESQVRLLARYSRRVVVNYDPDSAGQAATERSLTLLLEEGFEAKVLVLPGGMDPDLFIRRQGAAAYREKLSSAPNYLDYLTERASAQQDLKTAEGKVAAANAVLPFLVKVPNPLLRSELVNRLAERLRLDERMLREELKRAAAQGRKELEVRTEFAAGPVAPAERELLRAFLERGELAEEFLESLVEGGACEGLKTKNIFLRLLELRGTRETVEPDRLVEQLSAEEQRLVYDILFMSGDAPDRNRVIACIEALQRSRMAREREQVEGAIRAAEQAGDKARWQELLRVKSNLDKELGKVKAKKNKY